MNRILAIISIATLFIFGLCVDYYWSLQPRPGQAWKMIGSAEGHGDIYVVRAKDGKVRFIQAEYTIEMPEEYFKAGAVRK
jgi:hypothetical protein